MMDGGLSTAIIGFLMALWLVAATVAVWHGLSLRRQSLKILRQFSRLARLLETAPAIPVLVRGDGRIEASERFSRLLGLPGSAGSLTDLYGADDSGIAPQDLQKLEEYVRATQRSAASFSQALHIIHSDRRLLVVGNIADAAIYPNGAALLWFFDLTDNLQEWDNEKREAEEARAAFTAVSALIEASPLPMWHRGKDLRLNFVNQAYVKAVGAEDSETVVEQGVELIESLDDASAMSFAARALTTGVTQERVVSSTIGGNRRQMRVFDVPLGDAGIGGLAIDIQDLSDAKRQYQRLADAQRDLLDMMSAGVAQFDADRSLSFTNLPFRRLFAFRDSWLTEKPEFARVVDRMRENSKIPEVRDFPEWRSERENWFLSAQPNEENWLLPDGTHLRVLAQPMPSGGLLLIFEDRTKPAFDALLMVKKPVDIDVLLGALIAENRIVAADRGIELVLDVRSKSEVIAGDEKRLSRAIGYVVDNAIRYGRNGGRVLIITGAEKSGITIVISDDGPGMTNKEQATVFVDFRPAQIGGEQTTAQTRAGAGCRTGLGLPLARQLIEAHGGTLELQSESDIGTTVIIRLPRK